MRFRAALLELDRCLDQDRCRGRLDNECETLVLKGSDHHRKHEARLYLLGLRVECLAELHDVEATLTKCRADRRTRIRLPCRNLQLDVTNDFLCHDVAPWLGYMRKRLYVSSPVNNACTLCAGRLLLAAKPSQLGRNRVQPGSVSYTHL